MTEPIRILSDLHMGHKISRVRDVAALEPLIAGAGTVIFNGDTWQELAEPFYQRSREMLAELRELCRANEVEAIFLSGNHDPNWDGPGWIELAEGKIIITHGDAVLFDSSPWKREVLTGEARVAKAWENFPAADGDVNERIEVAREIARELCSVEYPTGRSFLLRAWDAAIPPTRALKMLEAWFTQDTQGDKFCERYFPHAELLIIGHFHRKGSWRKNGRRIINTGSFIAPDSAHWLEWKDGLLRHGVINESSGKFTIGETLEVLRF